jgi:hypothetical protein
MLRVFLNRSYLWSYPTKRHNPLSRTRMQLTRCVESPRFWHRRGSNAERELPREDSHEECEISSE